MTYQRSQATELSNWYYTLACVLVLFGILGMLSIGFPFFTLGVAMFCLAPFAKRRSPVVVPILVALGTFWAILFALGPVTCSESVIRSERREGRQRPIEVSSTCNQEPNTFAIATVAAFGIGVSSWLALRSGITRETAK